jgi:hypothetical protein
VIEILMQRMNQKFCPHLPATQYTKPPRKTAAASKAVSLSAIKPLSATAVAAVASAAAPTSAEASVKK